jgi:hypothetical protein
MLTTFLFSHPRYQALIEEPCTSQVVERCVAVNITQTDLCSSKLIDDEPAHIFLLLQLACDVSWHQLSSFKLPFLRSKYPAT